MLLHLELAIAAPNENEGTGAVYIYSYDDMSRSLTLSQKISGKDVHSSLKGFGISLSRPTDIDDNGFLGTNFYIFLSKKIKMFFFFRFCCWFSNFWACGITANQTDRNGIYQHKSTQKL